MLQITLAKVVQSITTMEEELLARQKKYRQANSNSEKLDEKYEDHHKPKRKDIKVKFDISRKGVYC